MDIVDTIDNVARRLSSRGDNALASSLGAVAGSLQALFFGPGEQYTGARVDAADEVLGISVHQDTYLGGWHAIIRIHGQAEHRTPTLPSPNEALDEAVRLLQASHG